MIDQHTIDGDALIATFMSLDVYHSHGISTYSSTRVGEAGVIDIIFEGHSDTLGYSQSWNRLMPVIEKLSETPILYEDVDARSPEETHYMRTFGMLHTDGTHMVRFNCAPIFYGNTILKAAYPAVVAQIKMHNELIEADAASQLLPDLECHRCKRSYKKLTDYNGHNHMVCDHCMRIFRE